MSRKSNNLKQGSHLRESEGEDDRRRRCESARDLVRERWKERERARGEQREIERERKFVCVTEKQKRPQDPFGHWVAREKEKEDKG